MAELNATQSPRALDMSNLPVISGWITGTVSQVRITTGSEQQNYFGNFQFSPTGVVTGTVNSVYYRNSSTESQYSITGLAFDALTVASHVGVGQTAQLKALLLGGGDIIRATAGADVLMGYGGNDHFFGYAGNDIIDGGSGTDTVYLSGLRAHTVVTPTTTGYQLSSAANGTDQVTNVERIRFDDKAVAYDIDGVAGQAYRLYQAAFDRKPDLGGLGTWIYHMDNGLSFHDVSSMFQRSDEFINRYGATPATEKFVTSLYENVLHRAPDPVGLAGWVNALNANQISREQTLIGFSESPENKAALIGVIQNGMEFIPVG